MHIHKYKNAQIHIINEQKHTNAQTKPHNKNKKQNQSQKQYISLLVTWTYEIQTFKTLNSQKNQQIKAQGYIKKNLQNKHKKQRKTNSKKQKQVEKNNNNIINNSNNKIMQIYQMQQ